MQRNPFAQEERTVWQAYNIQVYVQSRLLVKKTKHSDGDNDDDDDLASTETSCPQQVVLTKKEIHQILSDHLARLK